VVIFVNSERSGQRVLASLTVWLEKHLKRRINATKSGVNRPGNGKFLGFHLDAEGHTKPAATSLDRFKAKVRDCWNARRAATPAGTDCGVAALRARVVELLSHQRRRQRHPPKGRVDTPP